MKKVLVCNNCHTENPFYHLICTKCSAFLRTKIPNIDLWDTLWKLLESPVKTGEYIIQADHKNFVSTVLVLAGIKIGIAFLIISNALSLSKYEIENYFQFILLGAVVFIVSLVVASFLITILNNLLGLKNRFKDNLALYSYSFLPIVLTLIILTPIQLAIYGTYWFTFNPSPLFFKPLTTYVMLFLEGLFFLWSLFLLVTSTYSQSKNIVYSIVVGIGIVVVISAGSFFTMV